MTQDGPFVLAVSGSASRRLDAFELARSSCPDVAGFEVYDFFDWITLGPQEALKGRIQRIRGTSWHWVHRLVESPHLIVEEPLRSFLDEGPAATSLFQVLWEARHLRQEGRSPEVLLRTLSRWLSGVPLSPLEQSRLEKFDLPELTEPRRVEVLLCLVALARQTGALSRVVVVFDGLESAVNTQDLKALRELEQVCAQIETWGRMGSGLGLLVGCSADATIKLRKLDSKLSSRLRLQV